MILGGESQVWVQIWLQSAMHIRFELDQRCLLDITLTYN